MPIEQIHSNQLFCGMYGLAMMLSISTQATSSKDIDDIGLYILFSNQKLIFQNFIYVMLSECWGFLAINKDKKKSLIQVNRLNK